jgi:hypothetical protein
MEIYCRKNILRSEKLMHERIFVEHEIISRELNSEFFLGIELSKKNYKGAVVGNFSPLNLVPIMK